MAVTAMAVETRPELVGKRFLCLALGEEARLERGESGRCWRGWRAGVIRAVSHRDSRNPDLAVRARTPLSLQPPAAPPLGVPPPHSVGLLLAPGSAGPTGGHSPLLRSWAGLPTYPAGVATSPRVASSVEAVIRLDLPAPARAVRPLSGWGSAAASPAVPRRPRRPHGKAGLRARRRACRWGWGRVARGGEGPASPSSVCKTLNSAKGLEI